MSNKTKVESYLLAYADLDCFFITVGRDIENGLIGYVDRKGNAWTLMEDDDQHVDEVPGAGVRVDGQHTL